MSVLTAAFQVAGLIAGLVIVAALLVLLEEALERRYGRAWAGIWTSLLAMAAGPLIVWVLAEPRPQTSIRGSNNTVIWIEAPAKDQGTRLQPCQ